MYIKSSWQQESTKHPNSSTNPNVIYSTFHSDIINKLQTRRRSNAEVLQTSSIIQTNSFWTNTRHEEDEEEAADRSIRTRFLKKWIYPKHTRFNSNQSVRSEKSWCECVKTCQSISSKAASNSLCALMSICLALYCSTKINDITVN